MSSAFEIHPADNTIKWNGAYNEDSGAYLDGSAVVTFALLADADGDPGDTIAGDLPMTYISGSDGVFRGKLPAAVTATLTMGTTYWIRATATDGDVVGQRDFEVIFARRGPKR